MISEYGRDHTENHLEEEPVFSDYMNIFKGICPIFVFLYLLVFEVDGNFAHTFISILVQ
jgi:hypothetical protein